MHRPKLVSLIIITSIVFIAATAVGVALFLKSRGSTSVAPTAPESQPAAAETCSFSFTVNPLGCYQGSCQTNSQCETGLVCDQDLEVCVNPDCPASQDCLSNR